MDYVPSRRYARAPEIYRHCQRIAEYYDLYDLAVFQTTVTRTEWHEDEKMWHVTTDRGDHMKARFVVCANGPMAKPKLSRIEGIPDFKGHSFHTSRWDYNYTGQNLESCRARKSPLLAPGQQPFR